MTRSALPRHVATVTLTVELSAADTDEADARLNRIADDMLTRFRKSTFARLPGKPEVSHIEWGDADLL